MTPKEMYEQWKIAHNEGRGPEYLASLTTEERNQVTKYAIETAKEAVKFFTGDKK